MKPRSMVLGTVFLVLVALLVAATVAMYRGTFRSTVPVVVSSDRAGLTMTRGAVVKVRGVQVGRVARVDARPHGADITIDIDQDKAAWIDKDATAQIEPPTAFGAKYVQLTTKTPRPADAVQAGDEIKADAVTVEVDEAFTNLARVLNAAQPDRVNNTLTALSGALEGRGERLGDLVTASDRYLADLDHALPALQSDLSQLDDTVDVYDRAAPDIVGLSDHVTTTANTLQSRESALQQALDSARSFSADGASFVDQNGDGLTSLLKTLDPVSQMLQRYAPMLPCTLQGVVVNGDYAKKVVGGVVPGIRTYTKLQPNDYPYRAPANLPKIGYDLGPGCYGLPTVTTAEDARPKPEMGTGVPATLDDPKPPADELATTFFGALAGLVNLL